MLSNHYADVEHRDIFGNLAGRYHRLMRVHHAGAVSLDNYKLELSQINIAMRDLAQSLPPHWTNEALIEAKFNPDAWDETPPTVNNSSPSKTWMWVAGFLALTLVGLGIWKLMTPTPPASDKPIVQQSPSTATQGSDNQSVSIPPVTTTTTPSRNEPTQRTVQKQPASTSPVNTKPAQTETQPVQTPSTSTTLATPDNKFRSFGKTVIVNDMELGMMGEKMAYRNVRTKQVLCCFKDATHFSNGKAYVSRDGVKYFYINTQGQEVPE
ncbi:MAG: hypothetical protein IT269_08835 [Saprospiraceae bacterium]|nr:hypothetical protein [Saprospiraceae bacterium]